MSLLRRVRLALLRVLDRDEELNDQQAEFRDWEPPR